MSIHFGYYMVLSTSGALLSILMICSMIFNLSEKLRDVFVLLILSLVQIINYANRVLLPGCPYRGIGILKRIV